MEQADQTGLNDKVAESEPYFRYVLRMTRHRVRLADMLSAVVLMLAVSVAFLLGMIVADHAVRGGLGLMTLWTLRWILIGVEAALAVGMIAFPILRRINDLYVARAIEKANPSFRNDFTDALELPGEAGLGPALAEVVQRRLSRRAAQESLRSPLSLRGLKLSAVVLGAVVASMLLYSAFSPKPISPSLLRAMGDTTVEAPTHTKILSIRPEDESSVLTGQEVAFEAILRDVRGPVSLQLVQDRSAATTSAETLAMSPAGRDVGGDRYAVTWRASSPRGWVSFQVICGDAESSWRRLRVLPPPAIRAIRIRKDWPDYTGRETSEEDGGRIEGPLGSRVTILARMNLPMKWASVIFDDGSAYSMEIDPTGTEAQTTFLLRADGKYRIRYALRDIEGQQESIPYDVRLTDDTAPTVRLAEPVGDVNLPANESLNLIGEATDDYGLAEVALVCEGSQGRKTIPLSRSSRPAPLARPIQVHLPAERLGKPGEELTCHVESRDLRPAEKPGQAAGQVGRSEKFRVTITAPSHRDDATETQAQSPPAEERKTTQESNDTAKSNPTASASKQESQASQQAEKGQSSDQPQKQNGGSKPTASTEQPPQTGAKDKKQTQANAQSKGSCESGTAKQGETPSSGQPQQQNGGKSAASAAEALRADAEDAQKLQALCSAMKTSQGQPSQSSMPGQTGSQAKSEASKGDNTRQGQQSKGAETAHSGSPRPSPNAARERQGDLDPVNEAALTPAAAEELESIGRALDEAVRQIRDGRVDPKLLEAMGMTQPEFRAFVEEYTKRFEEAVKGETDNKNRQTREVAAQATGDSNVRKGDASTMGDVAETPHMEAHRDAEAGQMKSRTVSPKYQEKLDAYFRAVSEGPAQGDDTPTQAP